MPTTSNFGWTTPADTDLVKDGAAAIRTLGNGIDNSFLDLKGGTTGQILSKASNTDLDYTWINNDQGDLTGLTAGVGISITSATGPVPTITNSSTDLITTAGDILYGTAADTVARLGIGTAGQFLKVNSGATAPEWAHQTYRLISRVAFSDVASQAFDDVFTSTYQKYYVTLDNMSAATTSDDLQLQFRYAGPTTQATGYYGSILMVDYAGTQTIAATNNANQFTISLSTGSTASSALGGGNLFFSGVGNSSTKPIVLSNYFDSEQARWSTGGSQANTARTYTGFLLKSSSTNITGTVSIYGLGNS